MFHAVAIRLHHLARIFANFPTALKSHLPLDLKAAKHRHKAVDATATEDRKDLPKANLTFLHLFDVILHSSKSQSHGHYSVTHIDVEALRLVLAVCQMPQQK